MTSRVEHQFLLFARDALEARPTRAPRTPLRSAQDGLTRDEGGAVVRRGLEDAIGKATLSWLARGGGLAARRYVVRGRRRQGTLFDPEVFGVVEPLRFTMASVCLLEGLHDQEPDQLRRVLLPPESLGDRLVFALALAEAAPEARAAVAGLAVLPGLRRLEVADPAGLEELLGAADVATVLRALEPDLVAGWLSATRAALGGGAEARSEWLEVAGVSVAAYAAAAARAGRHELLGALGEYYRRLLRDVSTPEEVLAFASEVAGEYRRVSDREAWLRRLGGLFSAAPLLEEHATRIRGLPFVEREEGEKLFFDEFQARAREAVERAAALHTALAGRIA